MANQEYWKNKERRADIAKNHTLSMNKEYRGEIENSVKNTTLYSSLPEKNPEIVLRNTDSVSAVFENAKAGKRMAVLNFASYKNPGGMFIEGSRAQEECLCHESFLYNVLKCFKNDYYLWNNDHLNKGLYKDRALYIPDIIFERRGQKTKCDVITCAAPNFSAASKYQNVSKEENAKVLFERIRYVLNIAKDKRVDILVLGAFGCGVFGQNPEEVAALFCNFLKYNDSYNFEKVVFAVPDAGSGAVNYEGFKKIIEG